MRYSLWFRRWETLLIAWEELSPTESSQSGTNTYRFWFPPRWTSFIWRVEISFSWVLTGEDVVAVAFSTKWYHWPKFRVLRPHGLQTRFEDLELSCTKENPTWRKISLKTTPRHSFRFEGLKMRFDEEWLWLGRFPNWILRKRKLRKAYSCLSLYYGTLHKMCLFFPEVIAKGF